MNVETMEGVKSNIVWDYHRKMKRQGYGALGSSILQL